MSFSIDAPLCNKYENIIFLNNEILQSVDTLKKTNSFNFKNKYFIETALPVFFKFLTHTGFIFFSIISMLETIRNMFNNKNRENKNHKLFR